MVKILFLSPPPFFTVLCLHLESILTAIPCLFGTDRLGQAPKKNNIGFIE